MDKELPQNVSKFKLLVKDALEHREGTHGHRVLVAIVTMTLLSVLAAVLNSVPALNQYDSIFIVTERICAVFFMAEFAARLWTSDDRKGYVFSFWGIVDMISFVPIVVALIPIDAAVIAQQMKILLVMRTFRIAKVARAYIEGVRAANQGNVSQDLNVKAYFLTLFTASIANGAVMHAIEGHQPHYATIPRSILEVMKIFMGTAAWPTQTIWGELFVLVVRFQALCLLGLLIEVMGSFMRGMLFGHSDGSSASNADVSGPSGTVLPDDK